ncbi:MAG TPA: response regulator [Trueperaceae bacterium]
MIEGSLRNLPLTDVFQVVATSQKSGTLSLIRGRRHARVLFDAGRITYAHLTPGVHLAEILVRMELVTVSEMLTLLSQQKKERSSLPLGRAAVAAGYLDEEGLRNALERQVLEVLSELLSWRTGSFSFGEQIDETLEGPEVKGFDAMMLLMQVAQEQSGSETDSAQPSAIYQQVGDPTKVEMSAPEWEVLTAVDGRRNAISVAAELDLPERRTYRLLRDLEQKRVVALSPFNIEVPLVLLVTPSNAHGRLLRLLLARSRALPHIEWEQSAALEFLEAHHPRAVIVDDHGNNGWDFIRDLRRLPAKAHLPVVALVPAGSERRAAGRARRVKALMLPKPFQELEFQQLLGRMVGSAAS